MYYFLQLIWNDNRPVLPISVIRHAWIKIYTSTYKSNCNKLSWDAYSKSRFDQDLLRSLVFNARTCKAGLIYLWGHSKKRWDVYSFHSRVYLIQVPWIIRDVFQPEPVPHLKRFPILLVRRRTPKIWSLTVLFNMKRMKFNISVARKPSVFPKMPELLPLGRQLQKVTWCLNWQHL